MSNIMNDILFDTRLAQIPENFPKQQTEVPPFYKYENGTPVVRAQIPKEFKSWETNFFGIEIPEYTSKVVLYHNVLEQNPWNPHANIDPTYNEFNPLTKRMESNVMRRGWADPSDINIIIPSTSPRPLDFYANNQSLIANGLNSIKEPTIRNVNFSVKQEIEQCQGYINWYMEINKIKTNNNLNYQQQKNCLRECLNELAKVCASDGMKLRFSYTGPIKLDTRGYPLNPIGRTGLKGRGTLGNWGPNHAADPVVCRANPQNKKLQFVLIKRLDNSQWALPGGIVEAGQTIADTRTREFAEEALGSEIKEGEDNSNYLARIKELELKLKEIFSFPTPDDILYQGVVDDPRNTDQSWMETNAILTLLDDTHVKLNLMAGDDAGKVKWVDYNENIKLFASHALFVKLAVEKLLQRNLIYCDSTTNEYYFV